MSLFRVKLAITTTEEIEVYAPDQDFAIDRALEVAEARPNVTKVKLLDIGETNAAQQTMTE